MTNEPHKRGPKVGRNDPCPCGSGRKFKRCHYQERFTIPELAFQRRMAEAQSKAHRILATRDIRERQRRAQQGLGNPIISTDFQGRTFVAVRNRPYYGKWKTFPDFLGHYIKDVLGGAWGNGEIAKPFDQRHPVMQWYQRLCELQQKHVGATGEIFEMPETGAVSAYYRLAYNLYLIAHNGSDIQTRLIERIKNPRGFQGAFFETQAAAWLIKAGFELEFEDESDRSRKHCDFTATFKSTGDKFSVEAKSRELETSGGRPKIQRKLHDALEKQAAHPRLVFLNLNRPLFTKESANRELDRAERIVRGAERNQVNGADPPAAYVCISNMNDQYAPEGLFPGSAIAFLGFRIPDFMGKYNSMREAARARERHWPMHQLFRSIEQHRHIPQTFDGELPSVAFSGAENRLRIGEVYLVQGPNGGEVPAELTEAIVSDGKAFCAFHDRASGASWLATVEMSSAEVADYERHPDTYFGEVRQRGRNAQSPMDLFDFFVECYAKAPREKLIELLGRRPGVDTTTLGHRDLVELLAEGYAYSVISRGAQPG